VLWGPDCLIYISSDALDLYAAGLTAGQILAKMPDLEADDLSAALVYASMDGKL